MHLLLFQQLPAVAVTTVATSVKDRAHLVGGEVCDGVRMVGGRGREMVHQIES